MTEAPETTTDDSVVFSETIRITLMITALNDHEVKLDGILNTYVQEPVTEKV